jgi:hypothetical protein
MVRGPVMVVRGMETVDKMEDGMVRMGKMVRGPEKVDKMEDGMVWMDKMMRGM